MFYDSMLGGYFGSEGVKYVCDIYETFLVVAILKLISHMARYMSHLSVFSSLTVCFH